MAPKAEEPAAAPGDEPPSGGTAAQAKPELPAWARRTMLTRADGTALPALLLPPERPATSVPGVLWVHGDDPDGRPREAFVPAAAEALWRHRPCAVLCLDHPEGLSDCHLALTWLRDSSRAYGIADDQLLVGGEGAGGALAVRLCAFERDEGFVSLSYGLPLYPSLGQDWQSGLPAMARGMGYRGMPPTTTVVGMDDSSRDDVVAFVQGMRAAGVEVDFHMYRGHLSGTGMAVDTPQVREATSFLLRQFDEAVATWRAPQQRMRPLDLPSIG